ncbi:MAG: type II toxin-antitoxin system ParD family antitoxin [Planctomycetia bacterium]|nr:type II toxin-antitoxin system ParD family antitoxin [Planctomycetia bacterium]
MTYTFPADIQTLITAHLTSGRYAEADEVLRDALRALSAENEDLVAVQEAIAEWRAGDMGTPADEVFDEIRREINAKSSSE